MRDRLDFLDTGNLPFTRDSPDVLAPEPEDNQESSDYKQDRSKDSTNDGNSVIVNPGQN